MIKQIYIYTYISKLGLKNPSLKHTKVTNHLRIRDKSLIKLLDNCRKYNINIYKNKKNCNFLFKENRKFF